MANEETKPSDQKPSDQKPERKPDAAAQGPRILAQGKPFESSPVAAPRKGAAGKYKVVHGSLSLGYDGTGAPVTAFPGAIVELNALDAAIALDAKTVEAVA